MGISVVLTESNLAVEPGESTSVELRVRNTGSVVDQITFQPLGKAAAWITVEPPSVRLFPETDATVTVAIAPPRNSASAPGITDWAVKALAQEDPDGAAVVEGTVDIGTFFDFGAELQPTTARARFAGRYDVAIDNRGNTSLPIRLSGTDAEQALEFDLSPVSIDTAPGSAHFAKLKVRPEKRMWRGQPKNHAFQLLVEPQLLSPPTVGDNGGEDGDFEQGGAGPAFDSKVLTGSLLQEPVIPKWLWKAMILLFLLLAALWVLWKTLVKPTVESAARAIAVEEVEEVEEQIAEVEEQVEDATAEVAQLDETVGEVVENVEDVANGGGAGGDGGGGALDNVFNGTTSPDNFRLVLDAAPDESATILGPVLDVTTTFLLTDVILQNPNGDSGRILIEIGGSQIVETSLESFRILDLKYIAPYLVDSGSPIGVSMTCAQPIAPATRCSAAVSFSGFETVTEPAEAE